MKKILAVVALVSIGVMKEAPADEMGDCIQRAQTAYALVHARDGGKPIENILQYIKDNQPPKFQPILNRIVHNVYNNPKLTRESAYNGEFTYCLSKLPKKTTK